MAKRSNFAGTVKCMQRQDIEIQPYRDSFKEQMVSIWEKSVRATHDFLTPADVDYYKSIVVKIDFSFFQVFCLTQGENVLGFIGIADNKIEMLFLSPEHIGQGLGKTLVNFAVNTLKADKVDVNEQNYNAVRFYSKFGFVPYDRTEKDSEGKDFPILKMRLGDARQL